MPYISQHTIDQIREYRLSEALKSHVSLQRAGQLFKAKSPFADEKTPSFMVSDAKGIWKCYSSGNGGKDLISFLMKKDNLEFFDATIKAAQELSIPIEYEEETEDQKEKRKQKESLKDIIHKAHNTYINKFNRLAEEHWAKKYMLDQRAFSQYTLDLFDIGYASDDNYLTPIFKNEALLAEGLELGLIKQDQHNSVHHYDFFRDRIIFPIYDIRRDVVGFGGRINPEKTDVKQKYLNSAESEIFNKRNLLYGWHLAKDGIQQFGYVMLVEGFTDVMRMHQIGFTNCVATLGTALSDQQIKLLKSITDKVVLFRDSDEAGQKATLRDMDLLLKNSMVVEMVVPEKTTDDPDSIGQEYGEGTIDYVSALIEDAILYQIRVLYNGFYEEAKAQKEKEDQEEEERTGKKPRARKIILSPENKKAFINKLCISLHHISDPILKEQYIKLLSDRYQELNIKEIKGVLSIIEEENKPKRLSSGRQSAWDLPDLPFELEKKNIKLEDVEEDIKKYGVFQADNKIYILAENSFYKCVSNFSIEIVQHMSDENYAMKLIRICNIHGREKIFDVKSELVNTLGTFKNVVTSFGNFFFSGSASDHESLLKFLFDRMGNGRKVEILGWQPEGFWVWNNKIIIPGNREEELNSEGLFKFNKESYYIPSANSNYQNNMFKFGPQKRFRSIATNISHSEYFHQIYKVHREHAITGILFGIASVFQDIIVRDLNFFPLLFYFGPASTGKDNLCHAIQSFTGVPQTAIQLEGGASTIKAQIREFSQFNNGVSQLAEYKRGDAKLDGLLKGLWDRRGYKRGSIESKVATDEVPILGSTLLTGNDYPDAEALITRLLWEEMSVNEFDDEAKREYNKLSDILKKGISSLTDFFIHKRLYFEELFLDKYRANVKLLNDLPKFQDTTSRIIANHAVLLTVYQLFEKENFFPFGQSEIINHFAKMIKNQKKKLTSASPFIKFWDCLIMCMSGSVHDRLQVNKDFSFENGMLKFNFKFTYLKVQRMWISFKHESAPDVRDMKNILKEDHSFVSDGKAHRVNKIDKEASPTSVFCVDLTKLPEIHEAIAHQVNVQINQGTLFAKEEDVPSSNPNQFTESGKDDDENFF